MRPVVRVVLLLASRRPVPVRLLASAREAIVSPTDTLDAQAGMGSPDDGVTQPVIEPMPQPGTRTHGPRFWRRGLVLALLALLSVGVVQGLDIVQEFQAQSTRLAVAVAQQQEQLHALAFTLQALRTEFGIVTDELLSDRAPSAPRNDPAALAAVALSPTETRSLTSLMEQVATQGAQLTALAKEIVQIRSLAQSHEQPSTSRYRSPALTHSEPVASIEPPPSYAVTLPPALGAAGFPSARPRRTPPAR